MGRILQCARTTWRFYSDSIFCITVTAANNMESVIQVQCCIRRVTPSIRRVTPSMVLADRLLLGNTSQQA